MHSDGSPTVPHAVARSSLNHGAFREPIPQQDSELIGRRCSFPAFSRRDLPALAGGGRQVSRPLSGGLRGLVTESLSHGRRPPRRGESACAPSAACRKIDLSPSTGHRAELSAPWQRAHQRLRPGTARQLAALQHIDRVLRNHHAAVLDPEHCEAGEIGDEEEQSALEKSCQGRTFAQRRDARSSQSSPRPGSSPRVTRCGAS